jgi:hypothetical protein
MIVVAGTKRSGTSMWMQILKGAGFPVIGEAFPRRWEQNLKQANPQGFYESTLRRGINFTTNPDPDTGFYLHPAKTQSHVVKVFLPGLARTDHAFLHKVIISVRNWRDYASSVLRLEAMERTGRPVEGPVPVRLAPALEWWMENMIALRDVLTRQYSCHMVTYESVLENPAGAIGETLGWLGLPSDKAGAVAAVDPALRTQEEVGTPEGLKDHWIELFDEYYLRMHEGRPLRQPFLERLNKLHLELSPLILELQREAELQRRYAREARQPQQDPGHEAPEG